MPAFILGLLTSLVAILLIGEAFARLSLPSDIRQHFGRSSTQKGIYRPDPQLGVDYRSYGDFRAENSIRLAQLGALDDPTPTWLFFGNSFVQAPGMLADTMRRAQKDRRIFDLRQNVLLPLRAAQARLLLGAGLRPQRIVFVILPIDLLQIGKRPLSYIAVDPEGAITTRLRFPDPPWNQVVAGSRLATIAWIRSGRSDGDPGFNRRDVGLAPSPRVQADLLRIFNHLAETSRAFGVPVTVMAIPNREQIFGQAEFGFQEAVWELSRRAGLDYHDAREPLIGVADKASLFLPDWHFNERGNALLSRRLLEYLRAFDAPASPPKAP